MTGLHTVADIYCTCCSTVLGWKYVSFCTSLLRWLLSDMCGKDLEMLSWCRNELLRRVRSIRRANTF